jgi:T5SS/PEP-CTERM-associated repeat protein
MRSRKAFSCSIIVSLSLVLTLVWSCPAVASITAVGDIVPAYDSSDPWVLAGDLFLGASADANLVISGGSQVADTQAHMATGAGVDSTALVTGAGSRWENSGGLLLGEFGTGTLTVADGGTLITPGVTVGSEAGSVGTLLVTGPGTTWQGTPEYKWPPEGVPGPNAPSFIQLNATIGLHGTGSVTIADGAQVSADSGLLYLGYWEDGIGHLTVTGPNSVWEDTGTIEVGYHGTGTLLIADGGAVTSSNNGNIGSAGHATVTDPGSLWRIGQGLYVRGVLDVGAGGRVESEYAHVTGSATVTGPGSLWQSGRYLMVEGTLNIEAGGQVTDADAYVGYAEGSNGLVQVTGAGSRWENSHTLFLGDRGTGTVTVADGGTLVTSRVVVGNQAGSVGNLLVTGPGTTLQAAPAPGFPGTLSDGNTPETYLVATIGGDGTGNVTIADGARVAADGGALFLGYWPDGVGNLTVTGPNSVWEDAGLIQVGNYGAGALLISNGGTVVGTHEAYIGASYWPFLSDPTSRGSATVTDPNSLWRIGGGLYVGRTGQNELLVTAGGRVESESGQVDGTAEVAGAGSLWQNERGLTVGHSSEGWLDIEMGGRVTDANACVGRLEGADGLVNIRGAGSTWDTSAELQVGAAGQGSVAVEEGGRLTSRTGVLGAEASGQGVVEITGTDSVWEILPDSGSGLGGDLYVGQDGYGLLLIDNGGRVLSSGAYIGNMSSASGTVMLENAGTIWENSGELQVGVAGGGSMNVEDGAHLISRTGVLGVESTGTGLVLVDYPGSLWEILPDPNTGLGGDLSVGQAGNGGLQIGSFMESGVAGGTVAARNAVVGAQPGAEGLVSIEGPNSVLEIEQELVIGSRGDGGMFVRESGQVRTMLATIGGEVGGTGSVSVRTDGWWLSTGAIIVGNRGQGDVVISDGGHVYSDLTWMGMEAEGTADVLVTGPGSSLTSSACYVGGFGQSRLTVADGGLVGNLEAGVGLGAGGMGEVFVTGPDSLWEVEFNLTVAQDGEGWLTVSDGAHVTTRHAFIGTGLDGVGSVIVSGPNSVLQPSHVLYIGGDEEGPQGTGYLGIYSGGLVDGNDVTIWPTGTLMGDGTLRANLVRDYGTISPGASIGTLTVDGDLSVNDGVLEIEFDNEGNSDRLLVTGHVGFGGTVEPIPLDTIVGAHQYIVVEANSLSVELSGWLDPPFPPPEPEPVPGLLRTSVRRGSDEDVNSLLLYVTALPFDEPNIVQTDNQRSLGTALQELAGQDANEVTLALQRLATADEVRQAYDQLSGQTIPALAPVSVADTTKYMGTISHRLRDSVTVFSASAGLPLSPAGMGPDGMAGGDRLGVDAGRYGFAVGNGTPYLTDKPWAIWGSGYGLFGDRESESGVPGYDYHIYGGSFGLDYQFTERLLLGFGGGYSDGDINYSSSRDRADVSSTHAGLYGRYDTPWWYVDAIGTYADLDYETQRFVDLLGERLEGGPSGSLVSGYFEIGSYRWLSERCLIQPLAAFQLSSLHLDSFTESGGTAALHFDDKHYESYRGSLGVKVTQELFRHDDGWRASAELRGRWVHEFGDTQASLDAAFVDSPGVVFRVSDAKISRDSAVLGAGLDTWFGQSLRLFLDYTAELNSDNTLQVVGAGLEYRW